MGPGMFRSMRTAASACASISGVVAAIIAAIIASIISFSSILATPALADLRQAPVTVAYRSHAECVDAARAGKRAMSDDRESAHARRAFLDEGYDGEMFYISMGFDLRRSVVRVERTRAIWLCSGAVLRQTVHVSDWR